MPRLTVFMDITVILCTFNRSQTLSKALASVSAQAFPREVEWEVLVVDNNSGDNTREVVEDFGRRYPGRFRYLFEPQPGKSHALNAGIQEAGGEILAFMDDDVTVEEWWLQNLTAGLGDAGTAGAGGRILPQWECSPPNWLPRRGRYALAPLALFDLGPDAGQLAEPPFGTNMAFRKEMFARYGGFRTDLGPRPGCEIRNEDTEFGRRLLSAGEKIRYEPSAVVYHPVPEKRLKPEYFLAWWFDKGRADVREFGIRDVLCYWGLPLHVIRSLAVGILRWIVTLDPSLRFESKLKVWGNAGEIVECYRQSSGANAKRECNAQI